MKDPLFIAFAGLVVVIALLAYGFWLCGQRAYIDACDSAKIWWKK